MGEKVKVVTFFIVIRVHLYSTVTLQCIRMVIIYFLRLRNHTFIGSGLPFIQISPRYVSSSDGS